MEKLYIARVKFYITRQQKIKRDTFTLVQEGMPICLNEEMHASKKQQDRVFWFLMKNKIDRKKLSEYTYKIEISNIKFSSNIYGTTK